eukprot:60333-Amphidinium_carterae.1
MVGCADSSRTLLMYTQMFDDIKLWSKRWLASHADGLGMNGDGSVEPHTLLMWNTPVMSMVLMS